MKYNMSEFEDYLNTNVFQNGIRIIYERMGNPSWMYRFDRAEFRYDRKILNLYGESCLHLTIKFFDYAEVIKHSDAPTSIIIHTTKSTLYDETELEMWHIKRSD